MGVVTGRGLLVTVAVIAALAGAWVMSLRFTERHRDPAPPGMVLRIEAREVGALFDRIRVVPSPARPNEFWVCTEAYQDEPARVLAYEYPSGRFVGERRTPPPARWVPFDFDGDGVVDQLEQPDRGPAWGGALVRVRSGATQDVLFENLDLLEYECAKRANSLGDLDGDGFGELAVVFPRHGREYDLHWDDLILGVNSWICVVSGSRLFGDS